MDLLSKIKDLCFEHGISLAELERKLGLSNGSLSKWNKISPSVNKLEKVADYFSISVDYLLERENIQLSAKTLEVAKEIDRLSDDKVEAIKKLISTMIDIT